ncbi:MAG: hypothetical protein AB1640_04950, partial [bacterium]
MRAGGVPGFLALAVLALLWIYAYRMSANPLTWEEPRRCLVSMEMIERGDYLVPRLLGEIYQNKPPLQNWLLVLFAGNRLDRVGPFPLRMISILSVAGIALLLASLSAGGRFGCPAWAPALIFLTMGIVLQYGRSGEVDSLFSFWIVSAFWCFETGRKRGSASLQWVLSQLLLAPAILTKGLAPLFFYPPVLWRAWREPRAFPFSVRAFGAGLCAEILLVSAWLLPSTARVQSRSIDTWATAMGSGGAAGFLQHVLSYPLEIAANLLP